MRQPSHLCYRPMLGTLVNWSHPISEGLVSCILFNEGSGLGYWNLGSWDYIRHIRDMWNTILPTDTTIDTGIYGKTVKLNGNSIVRWDTDATGNNTFLSYPNLTVLIRHSTIHDDNWHVLFSMSNGLATDAVSLGINKSSGPGYLYINDDINNRNTNIFATSGAYISGLNPVSDSVMIIGKDTGRKIYRDGVLVGSDAYKVTGTEDITVVDRGLSLGGARSGGIYTGKYTGHIYHFYAWNRGLTEAELHTLWSHPYCFFYRRKPIYFLVGITYNIAGSIDSSSTVSGVVQPTFSITGDIGAASSISGSLVSSIEELLYETIELFSSITKIIAEESERESSLDFISNRQSFLSLESDRQSSIDLESIRTDTINLNSKFKE